MKKLNQDNKQKIIGAILSSIIFTSLYIIITIIISYFQFTEEEKLPWILYYIIIIFYTAPTIGIIINLINRIKEIKGGEEDEASKY